MLLTFIGIPGLLYDVQAKEDLAESVPWVSLGQVTAGANGEFTFTDADAALYPVRYYRSVGP
jgi:hypothetical protein